MRAVTVVVPTIGRPTLHRLVSRLDGLPVIVVDDRRDRSEPLLIPSDTTVVETTGGQGPAAARNLGWRSASTEWVVFVDDDVEPEHAWADRLAEDLAACDAASAASTGVVEVPMPEVHRPTDRERRVGALATARWITADMAVRRHVLESIGGFDERFRRAYREDSDLALRLVEADWVIRQGRRRVSHPVGEMPWWVSIRDQRGNRDDVLMWRIHGRGWRERVGAGRGMSRRHAAVTASALIALAARSPRTRLWAGAAWALGTAALAIQRVLPGPRTLSEIAAMIITSIAIPPTATFWRAVGLIFDRRRPDRDPENKIDAVLFDRDGTLVRDVPYNGDPRLVEPSPGAREAIRKLRRAGLKIGIVSNQSGIARGILSQEQAERVTRRVDELVGPFDTALHCPHSPDEGCWCRKPAPGLIFEAARRLGTDPHHCVVVGDILTDVMAAENAGGRGILVPTPATRPREVDAAEHVASGLVEAADMVLRWRRG